MAPGRLGHPQSDVIVVGSGATGGWAAKQLTEAGLTVLLLEAGAPMTPERLAAITNGGAARGGWSSDRAERFAFGRARQRQLVQSAHYAYNHATHGLYVDDLHNPYTVVSGKPFRWIRSRVLGGRTTLWNRVAPRMSRHQLKGASQIGLGRDWPLSYEDLQPYYDKIEAFVGLVGGALVHPDVPQGKRRFHRELTRPQQAFAATVRAAWSDREVGVCPEFAASGPTHAPMGPTDGFFSSVGSTIPAAMRTGRLTLRCGAVVDGLMIDEARRSVFGVTYIDRETRVRHEVTGRVVLLCASTLESTRLLFLAGLGQRSAALGRGLMDHVRGVRVWGSRPANASDFATVDNSWDGGGLYMPPCRDPSKRRDLERDFQLQGDVFADRHGGRVWCSLSAFGEMLPDDRNHVSLHPALRDELGVSCLHIECSHGEAEIAMLGRQVDTCVELLEAAGFTIDRGRSTIDLLPPGAGAHELGTARMGDDGETSVLDPNNECWELRNLFVSDGAAFVTSGFQNPTLTMMALTARACDRIIERVA